jgi:hypothetical protein
MATVAQLDTRLTVTEKTVEHHEKQLNGNGKMGLCERFDDVETDVTNHLTYHKKLEESEKERRDFWNKVLLLGIGMIISNVGVIIFALVK